MAGIVTVEPTHDHDRYPPKFYQGRRRRDLTRQCDVPRGAEEQRVTVIAVLKSPHRHAPRKRGIQYSAAFMGIETPAFTGSPAFAGDDSEFCRMRIPE